MQRPTGSTVGFVGVMDYFPNVDGVCWFVDECWAGIREAVPDAIFRIIGRRPVRRVRSLARAPGVEVVGEVEDVAAELARLDVSVAPLRIARGLQNKVLEAMAYGLPVVLTDHAARGIGADPNRDYVVASTPDRMIRQSVRLLCDPDCRGRIAASARRYVERHHRWADSLRHFDLLATGAIERSAVREPVEPIRRTAPTAQRSTALPVS